MEPTTIIVVALIAIPLVALLLLASARQRRARSLAPVRLGPSWEPADPGSEVEQRLTGDREARAQVIVERTGVDLRTADTVIGAWEEYLAVLGVIELPAAHTYRVYDPYDPPVAERGPDGPIPDPTRVARDVARRTGVAELDASTVLDALLGGPDEPTSSEADTG